MKANPNFNQSLPKILYVPFSCSISFGLSHRLHSSILPCGWTRLSKNQRRFQQSSDTHNNKKTQWSPTKWGLGRVRPLLETASLSIQGRGKNCVHPTFTRHLGGTTMRSCCREGKIYAYFTSNYTPIIVILIGHHLSPLLFLGFCLLMFFFLFFFGLVSAVRRHSQSCNTRQVPSRLKWK